MASLTNGSNRFGPRFEASPRGGSIVCPRGHTEFHRLSLDEVGKSAIAISSLCMSGVSGEHLAEFMVERQAGDPQLPGASTLESRG